MMSLLNSQSYKDVLLIGVLLPTLTQAELTVIYDNGQTKPIAPFLEAFGSNDQIPRQSLKPSRQQLGAADPQAWLPIQSPGLTPGQVQSRKHTRPFTRPFFMIGSDNWSRKWLQVHRDRLKEIGAVGMLVQAESLEDLQAIAELADGLSILPASGADIAQALGISHYPVLISAQGIEQ